MTAYCILKSFDFSGDPFDIFSLFKDEPHVFFLDSNLHQNKGGRYSFIGFDPFTIFSNKNQNALNDLRKLYRSYARSFQNIPTPFPAGMMGYFSYDFGLQLETIKHRATDDLLLPDCFFGLYDCVITVDHWTKKLHITSTGLPEKDNCLIKERAAWRLNYISKRLFHYAHNDTKNNDVLNVFSNEGFPTVGIVSNFTEPTYKQMIERALEYIAEGDIYQVNLSQRFSLDLNDYGARVDSVEMYRVLRKISPSGFGGYMHCGTFQLISNSPEQFLKLQNNIVQTRPMKGTRPRGHNEQEDRRLKKELLESKKDKAELLMITDLLRNDLGRACRYGSVTVKEMRTLEEYATVFQTTSSVEGVLREDKDCFDLIAACYAGGSITGCPKIRAMEIIEELEPTRRSIYTGSMGYFSFAGDMDFNILIRTLLATSEKLYFQVGGGIVADSIPEKEYEETLTKASALCRCLNIMRQKKVEV